MNLDELQSVQARERQSSDLQHLRSSFYREVGEYVRQLTEERDRAVDEAEDPFSSPEVRRLTDDIETAEQTVEAIYERRVGKVVKKASIAAAGMPVEEDGLTAEEEALFEDLVRRIEENRQSVLSILSGDGAVETGEYGAGSDTGTERTGGDAETPDGDGPAGDRAGEDETDGVDAASLMGSGDDAGASGVSETPDAGGTDDGGRTEVPPEPAPPGEGPDDSESEPDNDADDDAGHDADDDADHDPNEPGASGETEETDDASGGQTVPGLPRTTVRITADVGRMVGADNRDYDLGEEDVVSLPEPNAAVLVEKDAAERLE